MKLGNFWIVAIGIAIFSSSHADDNRWLSVDVQRFEIAGVGLGMDFEQARTAAAKHFHVPAKEIRPQSAAFGLEASKNTITQTKLPDEFIYRGSNGEKLIVTFSTRIPVDKAHPLVADSVKYMSGGSEESRAMLREAARTKYGVPSFTAYGMDHWCRNPKKLLCHVKLGRLFYVQAQEC